MLQTIYVACTLELNCNQAVALPFIWDIKNIEYCEVKADQVEVTKETERSGTYMVKGHFGGKKGLFAGVPWQRKFAYQLHATGFHSVEAQQPPSAFNIQGGFTVEAVNEQQCRVRHYEQYRLPLKFLLLKPLLVLYLQWSQRQELRDLESLIMRNIPAQVTFKPELTRPL